MARMLYSSGRAFKGASLVENALRAFFPSYGSADYDISQDRETIALRARSLFQNHAFSRALIKSFDVNIVGTGIKVRPALRMLDVLGISQEDADKWCYKTRNMFEIWAKSLKCDAERCNDLYGLQDLALKTELIGGEAFVLKKFFANREPFGMCLKVLEGDRVQNPFGYPDCDDCCGGIEVDENHTPVAYHVTKKIPFSIDNYGNNVDTVRIPAFDSMDNPNVLHVFETDRTDQRRGISMLAPLIVDAKQLDRFKDARLMKALVTSLLTAVIESADESSPSPLLGNIPDAERVEQADSEGNIPGTDEAAAAEFGSGNMIEMPKGQKVHVIESSKPDDGYTSFVDALHTEDAAACGTSSEIVMRKFGTSYNAVRAAILESKKTYDKCRAGFISKFCKPVYEAWLTQAVMTGAVEAPGFLDDPVKRSFWSDCTWVADSAFLLDPLKETQAIKLQLDEQLTSRDAACAALFGTEYKENAIRLSDEKGFRGSISLPEPGTINKNESFSVSTDDVEESDL